jgi:outer membrane protein OmpA-like peptidoglycan-associated protein
MGGFDFFQSQGSMGKWVEPVNLGYPVNSVRDDIYLISRGSKKNLLENVMLSSDRESACCLELFALKKIRPLRKISGRIVSCDTAKSLVTAKVNIVDTVNNKTVLSGSVGADGTYSFTLEDFQPLKVSAEAEGFFGKSMHMEIPTDSEAESMEYPDLCLLPVPPPPKEEEKFVIENVYYEFDRSELKPESFPALDVIVRMLNTYPGMIIELGAHTDAMGKENYNLKLSQARAQSVVNYLVEKGIDISRLVPMGYGETMPVEPNTIDGKDNPDGRAKNRRTEFKVLKSE